MDLIYWLRLPFLCLSQRPRLSTVRGKHLSSRATLMIQSPKYPWLDHKNDVMRCGPMDLKHYREWPRLAIINP